MTPSVAADRPGLLRRALRLEYLTVGWNIIEGLIAVTAGLASGSVALEFFDVAADESAVCGHDGTDPHADLRHHDPLAASAGQSS